MKIIGKIKKYLWHITPARIILAGFLALILIGALLLTMPLSSKSGLITNFTDSLFTSVSAVCVTGLVVVDTNTHWSLFGQIIILLMIQIGALGVVSITTIASIITGTKLGLVQRLTIQETLNRFTLNNIVTVFQKVILITLALEACGALLLSIQLVPQYGWLPGIGKSIFLAVSSFCNAGFDVLGTTEAPFVSMTGFSGSWLVLMTSAALIIIGGLGFIVWDELIIVRKFSLFSLHTKAVLVVTACLLVFGTAGYFLLERDASMASMHVGNRLLNSIFHSVSARTAGYNSVDIGQMSEAGKLLTMFLMFIGAAPGSTAGGIKVTTFFVLGLSVVAYLRGRKDLQVMGRRIPESIISRAVSVFCLSLTIIIMATVVLLINNDGTFMQSLFESVSAFGTVGLTTGITPGLSTVGKYAMMLSMFVGRIGTMTAIAVFVTKAAQSGKTYRFPDGKISVG